MNKIVALLAFVAAAQAVYVQDPHVGTQAEHTVRGFGGLSTVSHQSKAVVSPHSHVQKVDTRVTNDASYAYAAPAYHHGYAAPAVAAHGYAAPAVAYGNAAHTYSHGYAAPALAHHGHAYAAAPAVHHGYAAPALAHGYAAAPAVHHGYAAPALAHGYAAPAVAAHGYAAPALAHGYAARPAYSHVPAVATHTFTRTIGGYGAYGYGY